MPENYLVLDGVYYWFLEETWYESTARVRLHQLLLKEGKDVVLLKIRRKTNHLSFNYIIYERDTDNTGPNFNINREEPDEHDNIPLH